MLFWIIKIIFFSIIFIFLIHNILNFLLETLTISKTKDIIQITNQNYKNIYNILSQNVDNDNEDLKEKENKNNITLIDSLPNTISDDNMKNELANYLREQLNH
jgi:hypothetical protein